MKLITIETTKVTEYKIHHPIHGILFLKDWYSNENDKIIDSRIYTEHGDEITEDDAYISNPCALLEEVQDFIGTLSQAEPQPLKQIKTIMPNKVKMNLVGLDGNAFNLMGCFQREARKQGWSREDTEAVISKCMSGSYDDLLCTLIDNTESIKEEDDEK